jgi:small subunit ribosomal protein S9
MADEPTEHTDEPTEHTEQQSKPAEPTPAAPAAAESAAEAVEEVSEQPAVEEPAVEEPAATEESAAAEPVAEEPVVEQPAVGDPVAEAEEPVAEEPVEGSVAEGSASTEAADSEEEDEPTPRVKPTVPGAHLEVDIVPEGVDPLAPEQPADPYAIEEYDEPQVEEESEGGQLSEPISTAAIDLAAGARYKATGKRKTAIARVILRPGSGAYLVNGRALDEHFPRTTLQRNIRQPLETVGYQDRMDVVARLHGGGISAQAGALRHGISRALLEADPNLRGELKRRGFLTRDSRAKERKKAGLKKARKRPQFSKR